MNKWLLLFLLHCCTFAQASFHQTRTEEAVSMKAVSDVSIRFGFKSVCADLIAIATPADLALASYFIQEDLYFKNTSGSTDRYLVFIKTLMAQMAQNSADYSHEAISRRLRAKCTSQEGVNLCLRVDAAIHSAPVSQSTTNGYGTVMHYLLLGYITLFDMDPRDLPLIADVVGSHEKVFVIAYDNIQKLSPLCQDVLNGCLRNLYRQQFGFLSDRDLTAKIGRYKSELLDQIKRSKEPAREASPQDDAVEFFLQGLPDEDLCQALCLFYNPFLHQTLTQGMLIKILIASKGTNYSRTDRLALIHAIRNRLLLNNPRSKAAAENFKRNLKNLVAGIKTAIGGEKHSLDPFMRELLTKLSPQRQKFLENLFELYEQCGFYEARVSDKQEPVICLKDAEPLFDDIKDITDPDLLRLQIRDMCMTVEPQAATSLFLLALKDVQGRNSLIDPMVEQNAQLQAMVDADLQVYLNGQEALNGLKEKRDSLAKKVAGLETQLEIMKALKATVTTQKKQLAERAVAPAAASPAANMRHDIELAQKNAHISRLEKELNGLKAPEGDEDDIRTQLRYTRASLTRFTKTKERYKEALDKAGLKLLKDDQLLVVNQLKLAKVAQGAQEVPEATTSKKRPSEGAPKETKKKQSGSDRPAAQFRPVDSQKK